MKKIFYISLILALLFIVADVYSQYPNRQVTGNPYDQSETAIAVSPLNSMNIIGAWNDYRIDNNRIYRAGVGISTDGGGTWRDSILDASSLEGLSGYDYGCNPSVAFDRYGNVYYCYVAVGQDGDSAAIVVARSNNQGQNWTYTKVSSRIELQDKPWITVDKTGGTNDGRIYVSWTDMRELSGGCNYTILFSYSTDRGVTFSTPCTLATAYGITGEAIASLKPTNIIDTTALYNQYLQMAMPAVGSNGEVYVVWVQGELGIDTFKIKKSTNGGQSWISVTNPPAFIDLGTKYVGNARIIVHPWLAVAPNGDLLLVYNEWKSMNDKVPRVKFTRLPNGTQSWSTPVIVGEASGWQYFGCITVNQNNRITVGYMHSHQPTWPRQETWSATSTDNGASWSYEKISEIDSDPSLGSYYTYEYMGIASRAANNQAYYLWTDHRKGNADPYFISLVEVSSNLNAGWNMVSIPDTVRSPST
ncbi:MAG: sialidase family protein, partial [Bacteroidota bacterium]|nr:sialidase family protein [Bacteroidota bacterium]